MIYLSTLLFYQLDEDELEEAFTNGTISKELYEMAWKETKKLLNLIGNGEFHLLEMAKRHKDELMKQLGCKDEITMIIVYIREQMRAVILKLE